MIQSSFPFFLSSSFSSHRLVILFTILLLNPLPIIFGAPTKTSSDDSTTAVQRHKRDIDVDDGTNDFDEYLIVPDTEFVFEGLIGSSSLPKRKTTSNDRDDLLFFFFFFLFN